MVLKLRKTSASICSQPVTKGKLMSILLLQVGCKPDPIKDRNITKFSINDTLFKSKPLKL